MKVTFIDHSSFLVELSDKYLLFDYYRGELPAMDREKELYVFSSHSHYDHYNTEIFKLSDSFTKARYILSYDIEEEFEGDLMDLGKELSEKVREQVIFMEPHERKKISPFSGEGIETETLRSTDLGVAFIVTAEGKTIFHAGDFQWWDWPGEPKEDNLKAKGDFFSELLRIENKTMDVAFLVLDPRQESSEFWGMDTILSRVHVGTVFPMHFWGDFNIVKRYSERLEKGEVSFLSRPPRFVEIRRRGESFEL